MLPSITRQIRATAPYTTTINIDDQSDRWDRKKECLFRDLAAAKTLKAASPHDLQRLEELRQLRRKTKSAQSASQIVAEALAEQIDNVLNALHEYIQTRKRLAKARAQAEAREEIH